MSEFKEVEPLGFCGDLVDAAWIDWEKSLAMIADTPWTFEGAVKLRDWLNKALGSQEGRDE